MKRMVPISRPQLTLENAEHILAKFNPQKKVVVLGIRNYYEKTMGDPTGNDRGIYDDAMFIYAPGFFKSFNANVDPSVTREGVAVLKPGMYLYTLGMHDMKNPYLALRQFGNVTVIRDGGNGKEITDSPSNRFYIDIHKGKYDTTSSLGCQTVYPDQWLEFLGDIKILLNKYNQTIIPYCLYDADNT